MFYDIPRSVDSRESEGVNYLDGIAFSQGGASCGILELAQLSPRLSLVIVFTPPVMVTWGHLTNNHG